MMRARSEAIPIPPATTRTFFFRASSKGQLVPYGPLTPTTSPSLRPSSTLVTLPTFLMVLVNVSLSSGFEHKEKGASPMPKIESIIN